MSLKSVVVVGGSVAGLRAIQTLRTGGYDGDLTLISSEQELPYDRPPLSKEVLTGGKRAEDTTFRDHDYYHDADVELLLGHEATSLDLSARTIVADDKSVPFDGLVIACGASARTVEAWEALEGVYSLRTM